MNKCTVNNHTMYEFLIGQCYFWDRKDTNHIWVALDGYKVFDERYEALMAKAKEYGFFNTSLDFDRHSDKTFYTFKHK